MTRRYKDRIMILDVDSCLDDKDDSGIEFLLTTFNKLVFNQKYIGKKVPKLYFDIENKIIAYRDGIKLIIEKKKHISSSKTRYADYDISIYGNSPILSFDEFIAFCDNNITHKDALAILKFLSFHGVVVYEGNHVYLDPSWVINAVVSEVLDLKSNSGIISKEILEYHLNNIHPTVRPLVIEILERFEVICPICNDEWFAPLIVDNNWNGEFHENVYDKKFDINASAPLHGLFYLIMFRWFKINPDLNYCKFSKNIIFISYGNKRFDKCWIDLDGERRMILFIVKEKMDYG